MKKIISLLLVIILLASGLFVLTGCGSEETGTVDIKNTQELVYDYSGTSVKVRVPNDATPAYEFTKTKPENKIGFSGSFYLVGEKVNMAFSSSKLFGDGVDTFDKFVEYLKSDKYTGTYEIEEETTIGDRKAIRLDYKYGSTSDPDILYGYTYLVDADNTDAGYYYEISVVKSDFTLGNVPETIEGVSSILNSLRFEK